MNQTYEEIEIDLSRVMRSVVNRLWLAVFIGVLCAALIFTGSFLLITPQYEASAKFYVNNNSISVDGASLSLSANDLTTSRNLVDSYIIILKTRETLRDVIEYADVNVTCSELKKMIHAESVEDTEIFEVTVTAETPEQAERLANAVAYVLPKRIGTIIEGTSAKVVEEAIVPDHASSPNYKKNAVMGMAFGLISTLGIVALREIFNTSIWTEEDIALACHYPILAIIPDMVNCDKKRHYYGCRAEKNMGNAGDKPEKNSQTITEGISFVASEAYKLLRTKLEFSFADSHTSRLVGVSSALSGEGKSFSCVNLAASEAELDKNVLLIDCDMRRPTLAEKLRIDKKPGMSEYLSGQCELEEMIHKCKLSEDKNAFYAITAGQLPPNPVELLSSERMKSLLISLRDRYDYIILDMPPVGEVSDAMALAKYTDGMLLVVRQDYCNQNVLTDAVRQFEYINVKILGVILNAVGKGSENLYRKRHNEKCNESDFERAEESAEITDFCSCMPPETDNDGCESIT